MKGKLVKTEQNWLVFEPQIEASNSAPFVGVPLLLHPDQAKYMQSPLLNNEGKEVEFEIVEEYTDSHTNQVQKYAKLIHHSVDTNEMIEDDVEKLAKDFYWSKNPDRLIAENTRPDMIVGYIDGYNKAKSSLYTQEDIDNLLSMYTDDAPVSYVKRDYKKYLQLFKQPK
jgi:hypothetical protein